MENPLQQSLFIPDVWQQRAIQAMVEGFDVVVDAPTGAGKTFVFEKFLESGFRGHAVYTVPTRALANDKFREWKEAHWNVGIQTGDRSVRTSAPVVVATLETQKSRFLRGEGPDLLVVDEYQMLSDPERGVNYELVIALAPPGTRLLLLSGSVGNPEAIAGWLRRLGRQVVCVRHQERPVPLEEVHVESLPTRIPNTVDGYWPTVVARALRAEMAPLLVFTPQRRAAEELAWQLARMLPEEDPLILTPAQRQLAGVGLNRLLKSRVAVHHSGLDYRHRAGLIEPLAKAGQLRVVVATMGLAAGINFSMRSVLVTGREYRVSDQYRLVRPDELLQMFGRAGRRGLDRIGFVVVTPGRPRLTEARHLELKRSRRTDGPSMIAVMQQAAEAGEDPVPAAQQLSARLFSEERISLGLTHFKPTPDLRQRARGPVLKQSIEEIQTPNGEWERARAKRLVPLSECWMWYRRSWTPALSVPSVLQNVRFGNLCRLETGGDLPRYGREISLAHQQDVDKDDWTLSKGFFRLLREGTGQPGRWHRNRWRLERLEKKIFPVLGDCCLGGQLVDFDIRKGTLYVKLDYAKARIQAHLDRMGRGLLDPPRRKVAHEARLDYRAPTSSDESISRSPNTAAETWYQLGLIDDRKRPTRRGCLFSFFNHGEGLAIAAALEDPGYPVEELVEHIANLRAGHRFGAHEQHSGRLGMVCRSAFGHVNLPGYLSRGLPEGYGDGAAEWLFRSYAQWHQEGLSQSEMAWGDVERIRIEWRSLLNQVIAAPELDWPRWLELKQEAIRRIDLHASSDVEDHFPPLTPQQRKRHKSWLPL